MHKGATHQVTLLQHFAQSISSLSAPTAAAPTRRFTSQQRDGRRGVEQPPVTRDTFEAATRLVSGSQSKTTITESTGLVTHAVQVRTSVRFVMPTTEAPQLR
jgi:hypothetical protein